MAVTSWATLGIAELGPFLRPFGNKSHIYSFIIFDSWCVDTGRIIIVNGLRHVSLLCYYYCECEPAPVKS